MSSDKTNWAKSSYVIHLTYSKGSIWSYWELLNSWFLGVCYFFWVRLMKPEGCCSFVETSRGQWKHRGRQYGCGKRNFHQVTPSIFGSHANREEDKCETWALLAIRPLLNWDKSMSFFAKWIGSREARERLPEERWVLQTQAISTAFKLTVALTYKHLSFWLIIYFCRNRRILCSD